MRKALRTDLARVVTGQLLIAAVVTGAFLGLRPQTGATTAALYGGAVAVLLAWRMARTLAAAARPDAAAAGRLLARAALGRLMLVAVAFAVGLGTLRLEALPMLATFAACQLGFPIAAVLRA